MSDGQTPARCSGGGVIILAGACRARRDADNQKHRSACDGRADRAPAHPRQPQRFAALPPVCLMCHRLHRVDKAWARTKRSTARGLDQTQWTGVEGEASPRRSPTPRDRHRDPGHSIGRAQTVLKLVSRAQPAGHGAWRSRPACFVRRRGSHRLARHGPKLRLVAVDHRAHQRGRHIWASRPRPTSSRYLVPGKAFAARASGSQDLGRARRPVRTRSWLTAAIPLRRAGAPARRTAGSDGLCRGGPLKTQVRGHDDVDSVTITFSDPKIKLPRQGRLALFTTATSTAGPGVVTPTQDRMDPMFTIHSRRGWMQKIPSGTAGLLPARRTSGRLNTIATSVWDLPFPTSTRTSAPPRARLTPSGLTPPEVRASRSSWRRRSARWLIGASRPFAELSSRACTPAITFECRERHRHWRNRHRFDASDLMPRRRPGHFWTGFRTGQRQRL